MLHQVISICVLSTAMVKRTQAAYDKRACDLPVTHGTVLHEQSFRSALCELMNQEMKLSTRLGRTMVTQKELRMKYTKLLIQRQIQWGLRAKRQTVPAGVIQRVSEGNPWYHLLATSLGSNRIFLLSDNWQGMYLLLLLYSS